MTDPRLDVQLLPNDFVHLCMEVTDVVGGVEITAACRPIAFARIKAIVALSGTDSVPLFYRMASESREFVTYTALVPAALLEGPLAFEVREEDGASSRAFVAGRADVALPRGWLFEPFTLALRRQPGRFDIASLGRARWFFRTAEMTDVLSLYLTLIAAPNVAGEQDFRVTRVADGTIVHHAPLDAAPGRVAFRIPTKMHESFTQLGVFRGRAEVPPAVFRDRGLYALTAVSGARSVAIYPYNRNYFVKTAAWPVRIDGEQLVLRHFADPRTNEIRLHVGAV